MQISVFGWVNSVSAGKDNALDAAKARVRALEARMGFGCGVIVMMADPGAARRMREKRKREARGVDLLSDVPVTNLFGLIDYLIDHGLVGEDASADPKAVRIAVGKMLDGLVTRNSDIR